VKEMFETSLAPALAAASMIAPTFVKSLTVTVTLLRASYPMIVGG
jgi:hypothetical protein